MSHPDAPGDVHLEELDDKELVRRHVAGEPGAFGELFRRHRDRLWAVALRTCGNPEDAADGLQDGMVAAYRRAGSYQGRAAVTTWLHRVVVNACLDRLRAQQVRRAEPLPDVLPVHLEEYGPRGADGPPSPDPAAEVVRGETRRAVLEALAELPLEQRAALVLVDMEGHSVAEAADILRCAVGTVKSRCSRGRARLAVLLADLLEDAETPVTPPPGNPEGRRAVPPVEPRGPPTA
ncbi:RNA polymerase sigma factor SigM [Nocardioides bruguierae]|uniref:RNA polymerase sigma factor SigM n=1 Tax=Nocardioides bruguierae TaxID=2945102 RepID=A0A9X2D7T9_9ACTN|nr:RNA polymerase sigma factor SigM [Nocardioides bruguierae]MCM0620968.1 RNA polymerase sigma factor SigM [Nocardioides bruguierae]